MLLSVKSNQKTLDRQISSQFQGKRRIPFTATDQEEKYGHDTLWERSAKEAPEHIKANWPGSAWIVELLTTMTTRKGTRRTTRHVFITSIRTTPEAVLRTVVINLLRRGGYRSIRPRACGSWPTTSRGCWRWEA